MALKILLVRPAELLKCRKTIVQEILLLMVKNLILYQHSAILDMLLDTLEDVLMLPPLILAHLGRLSMNCCQY